MSEHTKFWFQYFQKSPSHRPLLQPCVSINSCFCDSSQSILGDKLKTSLLTDKAECHRCRNLIYQRENRCCSMCGDCVEMLYSPKICEICHGRISYQDLMNANIKHELNIEDAENTKIIKLCNCFPKCPSQNFNFTQSNEITEAAMINGKSCFYNEIVHQPKDRKTSQYFSSHNCLPLRSHHNSSSNSSENDDD